MRVGSRARDGSPTVSSLSWIRESIQKTRPGCCSTRFDLQYAVKEVRRDAARTSVISRRLVKRIVRYLK